MKGRYDEVQIESRAAIRPTLLTCRSAQKMCLEPLLETPPTEMLQAGMRCVRMQLSCRLLADRCSWEPASTSELREQADIYDRRSRIKG